MGINIVPPVDDGPLNEKGKREIQQKKMANCVELFVKNLDLIKPSQQSDQARNRITEAYFWCLQAIEVEHQPDGGE